MNFPIEFRNNMQEFQESLDAIRQWEREIKGEKDQPVVKERVERQNKTHTVEKKQKLKSFDYSAWDKFDVEQALVEIDIQERNSESKERALELKTKGNELFKVGDYQEAINYYTKAIELDKTNPILYINRAQCNLKLNSYQKVVEDCSIALRYDHLNIKGLWRRGIAYRHLELFEKSFQDLSKALEKEPDNRKIANELEMTKKYTEWKEIPVKIVNKTRENQKTPVRDSVPKKPDVSTRLLKISPPKTAIDFIRDWKCLASELEQYEYMKSIKDFSILRKAIEPNHLVSMLKVICSLYKENEPVKEWLKLLNGLSKTDRFAMNFMFVPKEVKSDIHQLLSSFELSPDDDEHELLIELRKVYKK